MTRLAFLPIVAAGTLLVATAAAPAATILAIDFNSIPDGSTTPSPNATDLGFTAFNIGQFEATNATLTTDGLTVTVSRQKGARDREAPASTAARDLYTDGVYANDGSAGGRVFDLAVSGLSPLTNYSVTFYSFSAAFANAEKTVYSPTTGVGPEATLTFNRSSPPTTQEQYSVTTPITTDANGIFKYLISTPANVTGEPFLSGFEVATAAVPEPASVTAALAGLGMLLTQRRRSPRA